MAKGLTRGRLTAAGLVVAGGVLAILWWGPPWSWEPPWRWGRASDPGLTLYGNVDIRQVDLGLRVGGRLAATLVDEGDAVKAGAVLARLDPQPYEEALRAAQARMAERAADYDKLVHGPRVAEVAQARAVYARMRADLDGAEREFAKARMALPLRAISQAAYDQALAARDMAAARADEARQALRLLEEGYRAEDVAAGRAALDAARAAVDQARTALDDTVLRAPADGVILSRVREPGAVVGVGEGIFVLSLERPVWVRAYVPEPALGRLHPGQAVTLRSDGAPTHPDPTHFYPTHFYHGVVGYISPVAEFTPKTVETPELRTDLVYRLRIVVRDPDPALRQGMPVTVRVPAPPADQAEAGAGVGAGAGKNGPGKTRDD